LRKLEKKLERINCENLKKCWKQRNVKTIEKSISKTNVGNKKM